MNFGESSKNIALLIGTIVTVLASSEAGVRLFLGKYSALWNKEIYPFMEVDQELGYMPKPFQDLAKYQLPKWFRDGYRTNSDGLFDYEHAEKKGPRVLGLGDSFFQGYGVPHRESVLTLLEAASKTEVVKAGVLGFGTLQELGLLRRLYPKYSPDVVLLGFCVWNDVQDNMRWTYQSRFRQAGRPIVTVEGVVGGGFEFQAKRMLKRSALFCLLLDRLKYWPATRWLLFSLKLVEEIVPEEVQSYATQYSPSWKDGWNITFKALQELSLFTAERGAKLVVVIIPTVTEVHFDSWQRVSDYYFLDRARYEPDKPVEVLSQFLHRNNIVFLDLLPIFRRNGRQTFLYDSPSPGAHWNEAGNRLAAESIRVFLSERKLIE